MATDAVVHTVLNTYVKSSTVLVSAEESKKKFQQREKKFWLLGHEVEAVVDRLGVRDALVRARFVRLRPLGGALGQRRHRGARRLVTPRSLARGSLFAWPASNE